MNKPKRRTRRIFRLVLIPLLLLVVMQSILSFGTVILGGTFSNLRNYAVSQLGQITETRHTILENQMVGKWSSVGDTYDKVNLSLLNLLESKGISLDEFLSDASLHDDFLESLMPDFSDMMRQNSTTGAFLVLLPKGIESSGGSVSALYIRDGDPDTNPAGYSDILLSVGPSAVSQEYKLPLDINWRSRLNLAASGERDADRFIYEPYTAALKKPEYGVTNLCFWSRAFCLEGRETDSYRMITYSVPLMLDDGSVWGVMGTEISVSYLEENLPYREIDSEHQGGYLLLENIGEGSYYPVCFSGPVAGQAVMDSEIITPEPTGIEDLLSIKNQGRDDCVVIKPLRLYNSNTPFYESGWCIAGVESRDTLFGLSDTLSRVFGIATAFSLTVTIILSLILARHVTEPIRRLSDCIQSSPENQLNEIPPSYIAEVDELYNTVKRLTSRQKQIEYDLLEEKERYRFALQSTPDILISYDLDGDNATLYNYGNNGETSVKGFLKTLQNDNFIHPDDQRVVVACIAEAKEDISVSFRLLTNDGNAKEGKEEYRWYELSGRILPAGEGRPRTLLGAIHNIHDQKVQELKAYESLHRDPLTGLYRRASGENIVRNSISAGKKGCLVILDVRRLGELNDRLGIVVGNTVLQELGKLIVKCVGKEQLAKSVLLRLGGDELLIWLEGRTRKEAQDLADNIIKRAGELYSGFFTLELSCGCAETADGEKYHELLARACSALEYSKQCDIAQPVWAEDIEPDTETDVITPIEYSAEIHRGIVPLTFAFFDRGGEAGEVLSILLPKLARELGAKAILISYADHDFYTSTVTHCWPSSVSSEVQHFSAQDFSRISDELWHGGAAERKVEELSDAERRFVGVAEPVCADAYPMYDSGSYMGALVCIYETDQQRPNGKRLRELHEAIKVIEANLNRQRYDSASRAKSDFLSRMSHEIRTPMNAIIGMTYIAKTHTDDPKAVSEDLTKIDQSSKYLLGLINDILDMSRIESGKMNVERAPFDLYELVSEAGSLIRPQAAAKGISYSESLDITKSWVCGDILRINQVLINLLGNAVKFTPDGGSICLTVKQTDENVYFSVRDTGIGISPENQTRVFQSFEQAEKNTVRQFGGTGLGLAISNKLVHMMGGIIELDSELGKGSDFHFTLPLPTSAPPELPKDIIGNEKGEVSLEGVKILLVEDNELNIEIAQSILEMRGISVELAHNGREAVDKFLMSSPGDYDMIMMDIQMPVMDGLTATKLIRRSAHPLAQSIPIIAMTANAFDDDMKRSVESGMNGHLSKPLNVDLLYETIERTVRGKGM